MVRAREKLFRWFSDGEKSLEKSSALFSSRFNKVLERSRSTIGPPTGPKKAKRPRKDLDPTGARKPTEGSSSGNDSIYVDPV